jgi:hypothetical protein
LLQDSWSVTAHSTSQQYNIEHGGKSRQCFSESYGQLPLNRSNLSFQDPALVSRAVDFANFNPGFAVRSKGNSECKVVLALVDAAFLDSAEATVWMAQIGWKELFNGEKCYCSATHNSSCTAAIAWGAMVFAPRLPIITSLGLFPWI